MPPVVELLVPWWLLLLCLVAASLYSSVGHGGASAYLGILVLAGYGRPEIASVVLVLNIIVTTAGVINYHRADQFSAGLLFPFVLTSIPAAFLGGQLEVSGHAFSIILGAALFIASLRFLILDRAIRSRLMIRPSLRYGIGLPIGLGLGFLAGLIGIGGGIFLSPILLTLGWADAKKTAAVSAGFIILNSTSGLIAHMSRGALNFQLLWPLAVVVLLGGAMGSWWGAFRLPPLTLQRLMGVVLLAASVKLIWPLW